jgi:hypothetical protein
MGHYSNPRYGIIDFVLPNGWYASETQNGKKSIIVDMHPGTEKKHLDKLLDPASGTIATMTLEVQDKQELQNTATFLQY